MIAPAPIRSSTADRRRSSGQRSPHGITATLRPMLLAYEATDRLLRRQPASVGVPPVARESVEPLGEGSTKRAPAGMPSRPVGDRDQARRVPRGPASAAPRARA